jgi:crotonobetainyl-CoA:carnitine CoA-transferase CaiB-like acyl-CoA transferase
MPGPRVTKVLDFTALLPGPFATMALADMGDVVRVESPTRPDMVRFLLPFDGDVSAWHGVLNRNKRSLALDLKRPEAVAAVKRLVAAGGYDILIEQFRPGVMERLGLGYEALRALNPALIYVALTGYGQTGPLRDRAGHDNNYLALAGTLSYSGRVAAGPPPLGIQADVGGAMGSGRLLAASSSHRSRPVRRRQHVRPMAPGRPDRPLPRRRETPAPEGMALNGGRAYDLYQTQDGRWLSVGSLEPKFWEGFCIAIGRADLIAPGLGLDDGEQARVKAAVREAIAARPLAEWIAVFAPLDVCVEPVLTVPEMLAAPQTAARGLVVDVPRPGSGAQRQIASPWRFSEGAAEYRHVGAPLGQHTAEVLRAAGFSDEEIEALLRKAYWATTRTTGGH